MTQAPDASRPTLEKSEWPLSVEELARLRDLASKAKSSTWHDYALLIGVAGFALSLATGIISAYVGYRKDIHDQQAQFSALLERIQNLLLTQQDISQKYKGTDFEVTATNLITAEINTAIETADDLALRLGTNATTAELTSIAQVQYGFADPTIVQKLLNTALAAAQTANDESIALRNLGQLEIGKRTAAGRKNGEMLFGRAVSLETKYDSLSPYSINFLRAIGSLAWAGTISSYNCPEAQTHFAEGVTSLLANPRTPEMEQMRRTALASYAIGIGGVTACKPSEQTVLPP